MSGAPGRDKGGVETLASRKAARGATRPREDTASTGQQPSGAAVGEPAPAGGAAGGVGEASDLNAFAFLTRSRALQVLKRDTSAGRRLVPRAVPGVGVRGCGQPPGTVLAVMDTPAQLDVRAERPQSCTPPKRSSRSTGNCPMRPGKEVGSDPAPGPAGAGDRAAWLRGDFARRRRRAAQLAQHHQHREAPP